MIGALPPPAVGPYLATERLLNSPVLNRHCTVRFVDLSDPRDPATIGRLDITNLFLGLKHALQGLRALLFARIDIVYLGLSQGTWGYLRDLAFALPAVLVRKKVVLHLRGSEFGTFYRSEMPGPVRLMTRFLLARTARVIVLGESLRQVFDGLVCPSRIVAIPNGIACESFIRTHEPAPLSNSRRLLFLSGLRSRKGILELLQAMPRIVSAFPDVTLSVAGAWQSEEDREYARGIIERFGLHNCVHFLGEITGEDKARAFREHDLFVFTPTQPEGLPWVILEAMSAALPVVTSAQGAIPEVIEHGRHGLVVEASPDGIAQAVCQILSDPDGARAMGARALRRVRDHFSEETYISKLVQVFNAVHVGSRPVEPSRTATEVVAANTKPC